MANNKKDLFGKAVTNIAKLVLVLDNYHRLKMIRLLSKRDYYISELQKELDIKVYKSIHESIKKLEDSGIIILEKMHNTSGQKVLVKLDKDVFDILIKSEIISHLEEKHKIKNN